MTEFVSTVDVPGIRKFAYWREAVCTTFIKVDCTGDADRAFSGEIVTARAADVRFSHVKSAPHEVVRTADHIRKGREEMLLFSAQLRGRAVVVQDGRETVLEAGDLACYDSTRPYTLRLLDEFEQLVVHMPRLEFLDRFGRTQDLTARAVRGVTPMGAVVLPFLRNAASTIGLVEEETGRRLSDLSLSLLGAALGEVMLTEGKASQSQTRIALLYRAKSLIDANLQRPKLNSQMIARSLGISQRYLQMLFNDEETTVSDRIWSRRMERAKRQLTDPMLERESIGQIAYRCGFQSLPHFSRRFRTAYQLSPREFRGGLET